MTFPSAAELDRAAFELLMERAAGRAEDAAREGAERFEIDAWNPRQRAALSRVRSALEAKGYRVRRRLPPLRWLLDGLIVRTPL